MKPTAGRSRRGLAGRARLGFGRPRSTKVLRPRQPQVSIGVSWRYFLSVATNATVLPMAPAGVETGTSTSSRCSPREPQGIDGTNVCSAVPRLIPSMAIPCEDDTSSRDMLTLTCENLAVDPGQSTRSINRVVITSELEVLVLLAPVADAPLKYETRPRSIDALAAPKLRSAAPVEAARIVIAGPWTAVTTAVKVRGAPDACPKAAGCARSPKIATKNKSRDARVLSIENRSGPQAPISCPQQ